MSKNISRGYFTARRRAEVIYAFKVAIFAVFLAEVATFGFYYFVDPSHITKSMTAAAFISTVVVIPIGIFLERQKFQLECLTHQLEHMAQTDQMSGLLDRSHFLEKVGENLYTPKSGRPSGCFLFADLDHFKLLNDRFGHAVGDKAIVAVAEVLKKYEEQGAIVGRLGGEEFGLFLPHASKHQAMAVAENIRRSIRKLEVNKGELKRQLSVSIGASIHKAGQSLSDFVQDADECMYVAKTGGRNKVVLDRPKPDKAKKKAREPSQSSIRQTA